MQDEICYIFTGKKKNGTLKEFFIRLLKPVTDSANSNKSTVMHAFAIFQSPCFNQIKRIMH